MSESDLDAFIASEGGTGPPKAPSRCSTCMNFPQIESDIREFMRRKAEGELFLPTVSVVGAKSLLTFLEVRHGYNLSHASLVRHISLCLNLDHKTGRPR